ncbi:MAG: signal peptidase I [Acidobacteriota bacterium]
MFTAVYCLPIRAWLLLGAVIVSAVTGFMFVQGHVVTSDIVLYVIQPIMSILIAAVAFFASRGLSEHIRKTQEKAIIIAATLTIWFVLFFTMGVFTTYTRNALATSFIGVLTNTIAFGVVAVATEYARQRILMIAGRKNIIWFGGVVSAVFALGHLNLARLSTLTSGEEAVKLLISDIVPVIAASLLLTYIAITSGYASQLTYQLGVLAMMILPPIIPKLDWYLVGVTSLLLTIITYLTVDRANDTQRHLSHRHHTHRAFTTMWVISMVALSMFMTGFFAYRPLAIMSDSMAPVFRRGSLVIVQKVTNRLDISIGDIIQYETDGRMVTHRVVAITSDSSGQGKRIFTTKGDNNSSPDRPVAAEHVAGIVRSTIPFAGLPTVWLKELTVGNQSSNVNGMESARQ